MAAEPIEPTAEQVTAALDELVAYARRRADGHSMGAESYAQSGNPSSLASEIAAEQEQWARAYRKAAGRVRGLMSQDAQKGVQ